MKLALHQLPKFWKRLAPLLGAPAALLLSQEQAKAVLTYNIFESAGNVIVQASGSLDLTGASPSSEFPCGVNGALNSTIAFVCTGPNLPLRTFGITGPNSFNGSASIQPASSVAGLSTFLAGAYREFGINSSYISNTLIVSSATFNGTTLAGLGFTTTGLIGTWTLNGTSESIQVILGAPTPSGATVPGPLPLLGAGAAFGWSRRLRKRIAAPLITPPQT
jgi:hypothetical protein